MSNPKTPDLKRLLKECAKWHRMEAARFKNYFGRYARKVEKDHLAWARAIEEARERL